MDAAFATAVITAPETWKIVFVPDESFICGPVADAEETLGVLIFLERRGRFLGLRIPFY